jgi:hypothetical protein
MAPKHKVGVVATLVIMFGWAMVFSSRSQQPHLKMSFMSRATNEAHVKCVIGMTNHGDAVTYQGYAKESPAYWYVHEGLSGAVTNSPFWCGTGMGDRTLTANNGVQFEAWYAATNPPTRLILRYKEARLLDRLLARAPEFVRAKVPPREWRSAEVRLSS